MNGINAENRSGRPARTSSNTSCANATERLAPVVGRPADHFEVASDVGASRAGQATKPSRFECGLIPRKSWLDTAQAIKLLEAILKFAGAKKNIKTRSWRKKRTTQTVHLPNEPSESTVSGELRVDSKPEPLQQKSGSQTRAGAVVFLPNVISAKLMAIAQLESPCGLGWLHLCPRAMRCSLKQILTHFEIASLRLELPGCLSRVLLFSSR